MLPHTLFSHSLGGRVLVVSQRRRLPQISRCTLYELEQLTTQFDRADVVCPENPPVSIWTRRALRRGYEWFRVQPQLRTVPPAIARDYELAFVCCEDIGDLLTLGPLSAWLGRSKHKVCYIEEMWAADLPRRRHETVLLRQFDHVFLSCAGTVEPLARQAGVRVSYLPPSVDAVAFCPGDAPPTRSIDVYSMGRRSPTTHQAMLRLARERGWFYLYDTHAGNRVLEPFEHRALLAGLVKRSKFFIANRAKIDRNESHGQEEIGSRHFEGAAGGAVMIGDPPHCQTFRDHFDWPDAVVPMAFHHDEPEAVIAALAADPGRVARIRADNLRNVLSRHDWVYRWEKVLAAVGMPALPELLERKKLLQRLRTAVEPAMTPAAT